MPFTSIRLFAPDGLDPPQTGLTVAHVIADYLAAKESHVNAGLICRSTFLRAQLYCLAFVKDFGGIDVSECRKGDLKRFLALHPEYRSPFTKHDATGAIVTAFRWAADEGMVQACPYSRPRDLPAKLPRQPAWSPEVRAILNYARTHGRTKTRRAFRLALYFLWKSGVRTCELYTLRWEHWDDARAVFEKPSKSTHRTGELRLIVPKAKAVRLIRWLYRRCKSGPVFLNGRGRAWTKDSFGTLFRKHADGAGVRKELSAYCLRHGFCCELLDVGAGERQVADLLGQSSTRYVAWYGRGQRKKVDYLRRTADLSEKKT